MKKGNLMLLGVTGGLLILCILLAPPAAVLAADAYPSKTIRLIVPYPPGGGNDPYARLISDGLSKRLGKPVVIDYRGGAGGIIGTEAAAKSAPDGYTLLMITNTHVTNSALRADLPYDAIKDFSPIARMGTSPYTLSVHPSVSANSVKELIELAKQKPGQVSFGDAGIGGGPHMASERFKMMAGINTKIVHFKGGAASVTGVLGGQVNAAFNGGGIALTHSKAGKLRLLATAGTKRFWPDVPIIAETLPGFSTDFMMGIDAPAGTPAPIIDRLAKEIKAVMEADEAKKLYEVQGAMVDYLGPSEFGKYLEDELANYKKVVKAANIKVQD